MAKKVETVVENEVSQVVDYELVYIASPDLSEEALETRVNSVSQFISDHEGSIDEVQKWGKKKLAYPIKHRLEGYYVLTKFKMNPAQCKELEANLKISEEILRHMLIKIEN